MNYLATEAFVYAWIVGISIEIAKKMLEKYGENMGKMNYLKC